MSISRIGDELSCANGYAGATYIQLHYYKGRKINPVPAYYTDQWSAIAAFRELSGPSFWRDGIKSWNEVIPGKRPPVRYQHLRITVSKREWRMRVWKTQADLEHVYVAGYNENDYPHGCGTWKISWQMWDTWRGLLKSNPNKKGFQNELEGVANP